MLQNGHFTVSPQFLQTRYLKFALVGRQMTACFLFSSVFAICSFKISLMPVSLSSNI
ncbi:hypothetical protein VB002_02155 [Campylobacter concisus]